MQMFIGKLFQNLANILNIFSLITPIVEKFKIFSLIMHRVWKLKLPILSLKLEKSNKSIKGKSLYSLHMHKFVTVT